MKVCPKCGSVKTIKRRLKMSDKSNQMSALVDECVRCGAQGRFRHLHSNQTHSENQQNRV